MNCLGTRLYELRRAKHLSQEDVAEKLNVTRQTVSKWETDQSTPDFDKIAPLCELYGITSDELLTGERKEDGDNTSYSIEEDKEIIKKKALGIGLGILGYFIAIAWIMVSIETFHLNEVLSTAIFMILLGLATFTIVFTCIIYSRKKPTKEKTRGNKIYQGISGILGLVALIAYLLVSFTTGAWHISWIIWIVYAVVCEIVKLIFVLKGEEIEDEE